MSMSDNFENKKKRNYSGVPNLTRNGRPQIISDREVHKIVRRIRSICHKIPKTAATIFIL